MSFTIKRSAPWRCLKARIRFTPGRDYFFILNFFQATAGIYLSKTNIIVRKLWNIYQLLLIVHYGLALVRCLMTLNAAEEFNLIVNNIHVFSSITILNARSLVIGLNHGQFEKVRQFINGWKHRADDPRAREIRQKAYEHSVLVTVIFILNIIFQSISIPSSGMNETEPFLIPIDLNGAEMAGKKFVEAWYTFMWIPFSYIAASNFLTLYLALAGLRAEMRIVVDSFERVMERVDERIGGIDEDKALETSKEEKYWEYLQDELNHCVEHHGAVLESLKILKKLTNLSFLMLYYMTIVIIAFGVLIVIFNPAFDVFYVFAIDYTIRYTVECYVFCYMVSSFNAWHQSIEQIASHYDWIAQMKFSKRYARQYRGIRSTILIVMMQSQRSLDINCGGMFELTMERFTRIINLSYSVTMFFWSLKKFI